ncbi:histone-lysine N-methyltransferase PRDM9-like [Penaeus vannamei]|uniref:Histone-lysine N-methyltransferase PRDM9-like n=1 Tax=Penaeus vannamei TaxID=6689 RepID=A0A423TIQ8_PENVA|nr:histone-lysine N-methyltransferase PRDM9-like [Penaeus vannamei]
MVCLDRLFETAARKIVLASQPLGPSLSDSKVKGAGKGVWTNAHLPAHLVFGPYEGRVLSGHPEAGKESGYGWKIRGTGTRNTCIDAVDSAVSNWMRYVNCSRTEAETNLSTFQYKGQIYYKTDSAISRGSELMCWYGDDYGKDLGLSREPSKWKPAKKDVKDRQCEWCGLVYSSKDYLTRHLKVCRKRVHTYTPPIFSTRGSSSSSGSTKQCLREEAPQFPEKAFHETLRSPASDEYNTECSPRHPFDIRRWVRGTFRLLGRKRAMAEDAKQLFSTEEWLSFPEIEKNRFENILRNYKAMKDFGLDPKVPEFVVRQQRRRRNGLVAPTARPPRVPDDEGDDEWTPEKERSSSGHVGGGRRGGLKRKAEWSAPAWTGRSENYDDAPLSVDQVDVIPLWTPAKLVAGAKGTVKIMPTTADRSSGDSAAENVKPEDKGSFQFPCHSWQQKELPAESETLGVGSDEEVVRDGSEKDRARLTTPWPLTVCDSKVKGAGKGVWTNAHLPAHLVFGPYEGRVLSGHPEAGKESGYGWKIRGTGTRNTCIDAVDSAVSNWMRYVNCSRTEAETNLSTFQYKGQIYYKTDSAISRGSELMCWYGDDYGKDLGLSREPSKWKPAEDVKDRQCEWCGLVYSSKDYLTGHLKVCRKRVHTYTPPIFSTRGSSSSSGSTKQCLREEAPQFRKRRFMRHCRRGVGRRGRRRVSRPARTRARDPRRRPPVTPRPVLAGSENRTTPPVSLADGFPSLPPLVPPGWFPGVVQTLLRTVWTPRRPRLRVRSGKGTILRSDLGAPPFGNGIEKVFVVVEPEEEKGNRVEGRVSKRNSSREMSSARAS